MHVLLSRDQFRKTVFARDGEKCVICGSTNLLDAHHIMERRLFPDGGYYLDNGATLCGDGCHLKAEQTVLTCEQIREAAGITKVVLPPHLYDDQKYDKWGNPYLDNGMRMRGELFQDESVQKVLASVLNEFTWYVKYPRTYHLPWSPGVTKDDRVHQWKEGKAPWDGCPVVVTEKMDGENTTMYRDYIHARSIDGRNHPTRSWVKQLHSQIAHEIPDGWRVCGENLYAKHSIFYYALPSYFMVFSIWDDKNFCLSWKDTVDWCEMLGLVHVPVIYEGIWDIELIKRIQPFEIIQEGYVVRDAYPFHYRSFSNAVGKFVRANHVHTHGHWMREQIIPNQLGTDNVK